MRWTVKPSPKPRPGAAPIFSYNADSALMRKVLGNQARLDVTYDNAERTARWRHSDKNGASLTYFDYERDAKGLITKAVREATHTVYYTYDASDRLTAEIWALTGASPTEVYGFRYAYDLAGNRVRAKMNGEDTYYSYDPANQLMVRGTNAAYASPSYYVYDLNGSLTDLIEPSGTTKFAYNPAGLVARLLWRDASSAYFFYDGQLKRYAIIAAGVTNYFLWDGLNLLQELHADGTVKEEHTYSQTPIPGIGRLVETYRPGESAGNQMIYPVMDARGTIHKWIKSDGTTVLATQELDAFGRLIPGSASGTWPTRFIYQGQSWLRVRSGDGNQELYFPENRIYDPLIGRFLQDEPLLRNRPHKHYLYVLNNPVDRVDPLGLDETSEARARIMRDFEFQYGEVGQALLARFCEAGGRIETEDLWFTQLMGRRSKRDGLGITLDIDSEGAAVEELYRRLLEWQMSESLPDFVEHAMAMGWESATDINRMRAALIVEATQTALLPLTLALRFNPLAVAAEAFSAAAEHWREGEYGKAVLMGTLGTLSVLPVAAVAGAVTWGGAKVLGGAVTRGVASGSKTVGSLAERAFYIKFHHGTSYMAARSIVSNQAVSVKALVEGSRAYAPELGVGFYMSRSQNTAAQFAGVRPGGLGPGIVGANIARLRWWELRFRFGALDNLPVKDMRGHMQSFVPVSSVERFNKYARFTLEFPR